MTRTTSDHLAPGLAAADAGSQPHLPAAWRLFACALLALLALACGESGGSGGAGTPDDGGNPPLATEPVDLPPGQTVAELHWLPSQGFVSSYLVFVSRNQGPFDFNQMVATPDVEVTGVPGDEIRITVVAIGQQGDLSAASEPSVLIRFHPPLPEAVAAVSADAGGSPAVLPMGSTAAGEVGAASGASGPGASGAVGAVSVGEAAVDASGGPDEAAASNGGPASSPSFSRALRKWLLLADARLPLSSSRDATLAEAGAAWLAARLESGGLAGLTLVGTAERAEGALRDLVWRDASGQLFVSDGEAALEAEDTAATLERGLLLSASERFVALADVDGDGLREWIIEDSTTGEAWIRVDGNMYSSSARAAYQSESSRLVGVGEFDGLAGVELLWETGDHALALARPTGPAPAILAGAALPNGSELVAIADLDGDGRDDLVARSADGALAVGLTVIDGSTGAFWIEWSVGLVEAGAEVALLGTLDVDQDGRAELAWLVGDAVEIRAIGEQTPRAFEF